MSSSIRLGFAWVLLPMIVAVAAIRSGAPAGAAEPGSEPELRSLDSHFPFSVPADREAWEAQAERARMRMRVGLGIWPMPELAAPQPKRYGKARGEGFTVERITFVSLPGDGSDEAGEGLVVTGSLYQPDPLPEQPMPGVLCPHGHWADGRFHDAGEPRAKQQIATGAERFLSAARNPIQARCVQLARMGCTVLQWDMLGYADSTQISFERAHRFARQEAANEATDAGWLLFSPRAEAELQSVMGLQTINAVQAFEVLRTLPGVDPERIAVTGASGGGTQTFILAAIDSRVAAAFPAVMVSTGMQGGCTCENACYLRVDGGNIEIAACIAPRPLGLSAADDWTRNMAEDGFPELRELYGLYGAADRVELTPLTHFPHNYNHVSRTAMYGWINRVFKLGHASPVLESDFRRLPPEELTVWDDQHPQPPGGEPFERALLNGWAASTEAQLRERIDGGGDGGGERFREVAAPAFEALVGPVPPGDALQLETDGSAADAAPPDGSEEASEPEWQRGRLAGDGLERPVPVAIAGERAGVNRVVIALHVDGREAVERDRALWRAVVQQGEGRSALVAVDLEGQGSRRAFLTEEGEQPLVREDRLAAAYTYGYNRPLIARQARDVVALARWCRTSPLAAERVEVVAAGDAGPILALAGAVAGAAIDGGALQTGGFRFAEVPSIRDPRFLPGGSRYFDLPGMLALHAPRPLVLAGEASDEAFPVREMYGADGAVEFAGQEGADAAALVERLAGLVERGKAAPAD